MAVVVFVIVVDVVGIVGIVVIVGIEITLVKEVIVSGVVVLVLTVSATGSGQEVTIVAVVVVAVFGQTLDDDGIVIGSPITCCTSTLLGLIILLETAFRFGVFLVVSSSCKSKQGFLSCLDGGRRFSMWSLSFLISGFFSTITLND